MKGISIISREYKETIMSKTRPRQEPIAELKELLTDLCI